VTILRGTTRRAHQGDLESLLALDRLATIGEERSATVTTRVENDEVLLFESENRLIGFVVIRANSFFDFDFVEMLIVAGGERRKGVGNHLLDEAVNQSSTDRVFTSTNQSNLPMIGLLRKANWLFSGQLEGMDDGDPELVFFVDAR